MIRTVTADPGPVFPNGATGAGEGSDTVVFNTGSATVYVGSDFTVSPGTGIPLRPGSNITWAAGVPLYACADPGNTGALGFDDGAGSMFDAGGVANQLLAQGLPAQIAAKIAVSGAPPIDVNAVIFTTSYTTVAGADALSTVIDTSKFQSVTVRISEVDAATGAPIARNVELQWMDASGSSVRDTDGFALTGTNNAATGDAAIFTTYQTPVRGPDLTLKVRGNTKSGTTLNIQVIGSYKSLSSPRYVLRSGWWVTAGNNTFSGKGFDNFAGFILNNTPGNTTSDYYPPVKAGTALFAFDATGPAGAALQVAVLDLDANVVIYNSGHLTVPAGGILTTVSTQLELSNRPVDIFVQTTGSTAAWSFVRGSLSFLDHS